VPSFFSLSPPVFLPKNTCCINVGLLTPFASSAQKDHQALAVFAKLNSVARTEVQTQFKDTRTYTFRRGEIAPLKSIERDCNPRLGVVIQLLEPSVKWIPPLSVDILANRDHVIMVAQKILLR
jgi:hypothetical protein